MEKKYIIGVDGGGTKTDYLVFTTAGEWVDNLRVGSRSHEVLEGGFAEVEEKTLEDINYLLKKNGIKTSEVGAAAFGMAGIDTPAQLGKMKGILDKTGLKYVVSNDSLLGIKAGCPSGVGICSINGTGTVAAGINERGDILQVGGIGMATGDSAGGHYIATLAVRAVYDSYFRCGPRTILTDKIMKFFGIQDPLELLNTISDKFCRNREMDKAIVTYLFNAANESDAVAVDIVKELANQLAKSVSGCILGLDFKGLPEIVLAGSIWTKSNCPLLISHFKECIYQYTGKKLEPFPLKVIPAAGAVLWALELALGHPAGREQRTLIINNEVLNNL
ncbi:BadF/BadG/BcrA/BcrD ATPase family protein [Anaerocolumna sp. MB42-C2]|uniref:BadF/BadG/BcrA/BcrD ATPase family protein n=1 Tax=Anaerocolumna sp. MB42-C2 TaxID=3070997 RepID=UPI0027E0276F|nr:BadF/BadG/BcrA/BcrD ATPase family protein [Anaerocolumna sp. MB42-C2]WMJ86091.1 BadF/BadG/BcrA/BcrD ATPase family protein [Anaerocolumna sp. MB42-C2]